jgi:hypothetical protein
MAARATKTIKFRIINDPITLPFVIILHFEFFATSKKKDESEEL